MNFISIIFFAVVFPLSSFATIWFGFVNRQTDEAVVSGLSSGPIWGTGRELGYIQNDRFILGVGGYAMLRTDSNIISGYKGSAEELLNQIKDYFQVSRRRFVLATRDGSLFYTIGDRGCHERNEFCGAIEDSNFVAVGGGLAGEEVLKSARREFLNSRSDNSACILSDILYGILASGGEKKEFKTAYTMVLNLKSGNVDVAKSKDRHERELVEDILAQLKINSALCHN